MKASWPNLHNHSCYLLIQALPEQGYPNPSFTCVQKPKYLEIIFVYLSMQNQCQNSNPSVQHLTSQHSRHSTAMPPRLLPPYPALLNHASRINFPITTSRHRQSSNFTKINLDTNLDTLYCDDENVTEVSQSTLAIYLSIHPSTHSISSGARLVP